MADDKAAQARAVALRVLPFWDAPDVVKQFLETGDPELRDEARAAAGYQGRHIEKTEYGQAAANAAMWACGLAAEEVCFQEALHSAALALTSLDSMGDLREAKQAIAKARTAMDKAVEEYHRLSRDLPIVINRLNLSHHAQLVKELGVREPSE
jgi:hypothetical protein